MKNKPLKKNGSKAKRAMKTYSVLPLGFLAVGGALQTTNIVFFVVELVALLALVGYIIYTSVRNKQQQQLEAVDESVENNTVSNVYNTDTTNVYNNDTTNVYNSTATSSNKTDTLLEQFVASTSNEAPYEPATPTYNTNEASYEATATPAYDMTEEQTQAQPEAAATAAATAAPYKAPAEVKSKAPEVKSMTPEVKNYVPVIEKFTDDDSEEELTVTANKMKKEEVESVVQEADGRKILVQYNFSYKAKLYQSSAETQDFIGQVVDLFKSYPVAKTTASWRHLRAYIGRESLGYVLFRGRVPCIALALNPADYAETKYQISNMGAIKRFEKTPLLLKLTSERKVNFAKKLVQELMSSKGAQRGAVVETKHGHAFQTTEKLIDKKLVKVTMSEVVENRPAFFKTAKKKSK